MTTEEIIEGLEKAEEWPRVYRDRACSTWRIYASPSSEGHMVDFIFSPESTTNTIEDCERMGDELLTGPARAEVLERLGLTKKGSAK